MDASTLVVPVDLAAFCVGKTDVNGSSTQPYGTKDFARLAPAFSLLPYADDEGPVNRGPFTSDQVLPAAFQAASQPMGVGVHLHWSLPDTLTHGTQQSSGAVEFRPAPNRWMVIRIATNVASPTVPVTALNAWVIESDRLWDRTAGDIPLPTQNAVSLDVPVTTDPTEIPNQSSRTLGRIFPYEGWQEDPNASRAKLTAVGFGEVHFAASYEYCANVFGMWDTLDDLDPERFPPASTRLSYLVAGWHADAGDDPLSSVRYPPGGSREDDLAAIASQLDWVFPDPHGPLPKRTVYSALLTDVAWDPGHHYVQPRSPSPHLEIAVGNTGAEAVSALLAAQPDLKSLPHVEFVLNALQAGMLSRASLPGGLTDIDELLHQRTFASTNASTTWRITPASEADGGVAIRTDAPRGPLPPRTDAALAALNQAQAAFDQAYAEQEALRARVFTDWYRYMSIEYAPSGFPPGPVSANDARTFIESSVEVLNERQAALGVMRTAIDEQVAALRQAIGVDYVLDGTDGARYWNASNPVVLFSGDDVRPPRRNRASIAADGMLACRAGVDVIRDMAAGAAPGFTIVAAQLPTLTMPGDFAATITGLIGEAFFVDPWQAPVLAASVAALGGENNPARADFSSFVAAVAAAQAVFNDTNADAGSVAIRFDGVPPPAGEIKSWAIPWLPIVLQWQVSVHPYAIAPYDANFIVDHYELDVADIDLRYKGTPRVSPQYTRTYQGTIVLAHNTEVDLAEQIRGYLRNFPDSSVDAELREILANLDLSAQAQALSGFNQAFQMLDHVLQMDICDPLAILQGLYFSRFTNTVVKQAVGTRGADSPRANNSFSPLRNGAFSIDRLRIVDTFGQVLDLDEPTVIRAESLIAPGDTSGLMNLPPRLVQPTRLNFDLLPADDTAASPVVGWVLYNHLDKALAIYGAGGVAIGTFNLQGPLWQGAPGNAAAYGQPIEVAFATANPHLRDFALGLASSPDPLNYITALLAAIDGAVTFISPQTYRQDSSLAVLIGRPLALVRTAVKTQLLGLPAIDQGTNAFAQAVALNETIDRPDGDVPALRVPVRIGELADIDDGLVGYFIESGDASFHTFYSPAAPALAQGGVVQPRFDQVTVVTDESVPPVFLTLLVDPHAPVHATTGLLPMKQVVIPPDVIEGDLDAMAVTFLTTPVVSDGDPRMPVPEESGYAWDWVTQRPGEAGWLVEPVQTTGAVSSSVPRHAEEGWLSLRHIKKPAP